MLTPDQLTAIDRHLRKENWLLNEDLIAELTDHYVAGVENRLVQGIAFDVAIRETHTSFGGRKGLLKMEEDFQKNQARNSGRLVRNLLFAYFRLPRLGITFLILILVYSLIRLLSATRYFTWQDSWLFIGLLISMSVLYVLYFLTLAREFLKQNRQTKRFNQTLQLLVQGVTSFLLIGFYVHLWLPVDQVIFRYPLPSSVLITLFVIFELTTIELLFDQLHKNRTVKTA